MRFSSGESVRISSATFSVTCACQGQFFQLWITLSLVVLTKPFDLHQRH